jgi:hypothetical protein
MRILIDTGANLTAIDINQASESPSCHLSYVESRQWNNLEHTRDSRSNHIQIWQSSIRAHFHCQRFVGATFVWTKELKILHPEWPLQNCAKSHVRTNTVSKQPAANTGGYKEPPQKFLCNIKPQQTVIKWNPVTHRYERTRQQILVQANLITNM